MSLEPEIPVQPWRIGYYCLWCGYKLKPNERQIWFDDQKAQISKQAETATQQAKDTLSKQTEETNKISDDLNKQLKGASNNKVNELRPKIVLCYKPGGPTNAD